MRYDFRKLGLKIFILAVAVLLLMNQFPISINIKLFLSTLMFGSALFLIFFGQFEPPEDMDEEE